MTANLDVRKGKVSIEWFKGAKTNISYNCLDRWVVAGRGDVPCFLWEGNESSQTRVMTYEQVMSETCRVVSAGYVSVPNVCAGCVSAIWLLLRAPSVFSVFDSCIASIRDKCPVHAFRVKCQVNVVSLMPLFPPVLQLVHPPASAPLAGQLAEAAGREEG